MAVAAETIDISRRPEDVFSYVIDLTRYAEWQPSVTSVDSGGDSAMTIGSTASVTRRVGPRAMPTTEEITSLDRPNSWTVRGTGRPVTAIAKGRIEPLDNGERSRVTIGLEFEAGGIGRLLVPLPIRRIARKQLRRNLQALKERLESNR